MLDHGTYDMIPTVFRPMLLMVFSSSPGFVSEAARWVSMRGQACSMVTAAHPILFVDTKCVLTYSHTQHTHTYRHGYVQYFYIYMCVWIDIDTARCAFMLFKDRHVDSKTDRLT